MFFFNVCRLEGPIFVNSMARPRVYLDVEIGEEEVGRIVLELR